ncbi:MAG TPA: amidohydrolase family protein [Euzebya sp.]|nr:amidohydrolase family protein [Euzebya sp.]
MIDAHHHLWDPAARAYPWLAAAELAPIRRAYRLEDLRAHTDAAGVDRTVLVQTLPDIGETQDFLAIAARSDGLVSGVVGWVDLTDPGVADTLGQLRAAAGGSRLVGIRHQVQDEDDPRWLLRPAVLRGLGAVAAAGLAFDLLVLPHQLPAAVAAVAQVADGRFVLDHGAKPPIRSGGLEPWRTDLQHLAAHEHVSCKLSGLVTEADWQRWQTADLQPVAEVVLEAFGAGRVMAGSDWPVCELAASYEVVWQTTAQLIDRLSASEQSAVLGDVAIDVYRLDGDARP